MGGKGYLVAAALGLAGCGGSSPSTGNGAPTSTFSFIGGSGSTISFVGRNYYSGFTTPATDGSTGASSTSVTSPVTGNIYGYSANSFAGGVGAVSGIVNGASVITPPSSGTVTYSGTFELAGYEPPAGGSVVDTPVLFADSGPISLTADFGAGTLTGSGTGVAANPGGRDQTLAVSGVLNGADLTGSVSCAGGPGLVQGIVGTDEAIGSIHGKQAFGQVLYAGGFIAN